MATLRNGNYDVRMSDAVRAADAASDGVQFSVGTSTDTTGIVTVEVSGEVDLLTAPSVGAALTRAQSQASAVLLDLRRVGFLGSAGLSVLVDAARRADDHQARFAVLVTVHAVSRAIEVTGLDAALAVFADVSSALEHLAG